MASMSINAPNPEDKPLIAALESIADSEDVDILSLPPLGKVVDPDAIITLLDGEAKVVIEFEYEGYLVSLDSRGETSIEEL